MPQMPDNHSNTRIKKLSPLLINQLAAGEVVTRPSAVVKELLENALDAGATDIEIHITQGGMGMIEVVDNGTGIHPDDMVMAITRHATSKVADVANLHGITTLGFRGEALAATAAVSRLTLTSSHDDTGIGRQLQVAGILDGVPKLIPVVHHRGTTITVKDLYFNVPARRGNLKSIATEFGHIETIVREVALARADVALTLFHDNKKRLTLSSSSIHSNNGSANNSSVDDNESRHAHINRLPLSRLEQATGSSLADKALEIAIDLTSLVHQPRAYASNSFNDQAGINGWLWPITDSQNALPKLIYVNGRLVKEALISNQLRQLAQSAHLAGIGYALYFDLPTQWLNINVHPSKQRIKISSLNNIMAHLSHAIQSKLKNISAKERMAKKATPLIENNNAINANSIINTPINEQALNTDLAGKPYESTMLLQNRKPDRQVREVKQSYQLSESTSDTQSLTNTVHIPNDRLIQVAPLPYCLDIICLDAIKRLGGLALDSAVMKSIGDNILPWLLFYSESKFSVISAEVWQSQLDLLFDSESFRQNGDQKAADQKNGLPVHASDVNEQLAALSIQMSAQDVLAFKTDLEGLLTKHAIKSINSSRLAVLMLSSGPE